MRSYRRCRSCSALAVMFSCSVLLSRRLNNSAVALSRVRWTNTSRTSPSLSRSSAFCPITAGRLTRILLAHQIEIWNSEIVGRANHEGPCLVPKLAQALTRTECGFGPRLRTYSRSCIVNAFRNRYFAFTGFIGTPMPSRCIWASLNCASASPCSAAIKNQPAAST